MRPADSVSSLRVARLVAAVFFLQLLDSTIIVTSLPAMAANFGITTVGMSVGITTYILATATVIPAVGWLVKKFGARRVLVISIAEFVLSSLYCALATGVGMFVVRRIGQGASAALMVPVGRMLVLRNASKFQLMRAISTITWPALTAPVIGPILGAWMTEALSWQRNFLINLPLGVLCILPLLALIPDHRREADRPFDPGGIVLTALSLLLLVIELEIMASDRMILAGSRLFGAGVFILAIA